MKKIYFLLFIAVSAWFASCKSASKLYQKGNYDEAVQVAVKKLQKDPNDPKLKSVVQDAYRYAVTDHESRIRNYSSMDNEMKWEWMYNEYSDLQNLHNAIFKAPSVYELVRPKDYSSDINANAAKATYQQALHLQPSFNSEWTPKVLTASAHTGSGINDVWKLILAYKEQATRSGFFDHNRDLQNMEWFQDHFQHLLHSDYKGFKILQNQKKKLETQILKQKISPKLAAEKLLEEYHREVRKLKAKS